MHINEFNLFNHLPKDIKKHIIGLADLDTLINTCFLNRELHQICLPIAAERLKEAIPIYFSQLLEIDPKSVPQSLVTIRNFARSNFKIQIDGKAPCNLRTLPEAVTTRSRLNLIRQPDQSTLLKVKSYRWSKKIETLKTFHSFQEDTRIVRFKSFSLPNPSAKTQKYLNHTIYLTEGEQTLQNPPTQENAPPFFKLHVFLVRSQKSQLSSGNHLFSIPQDMAQFTKIIPQKSLIIKKITATAQGNTLNHSFKIFNYASREYQDIACGPKTTSQFWITKSYLCWQEEDEKVVGGATRTTYCYKLASLDHPEKIYTVEDIDQQDKLLKIKGHVLFFFKQHTIGNKTTSRLSLTNFVKCENYAPHTWSFSPAFEHSVRLFVKGERLAILGGVEKETFIYLKHLHNIHLGLEVYDSCKGFAANIFDFITLPNQNAIDPRAISFDGQQFTFLSNQEKYTGWADYRRQVRKITYTAPQQKPEDLQKEKEKLLASQLDPQIIEKKLYFMGLK